MELGFQEIQGSGGLQASRAQACGVHRTWLRGLLGSEFQSLILRKAGSMRVSSTAQSHPFPLTELPAATVSKISRWSGVNVPLGEGHSDYRGYIVVSI